MCQLNVKCNGKRKRADIQDERQRNDEKKERDIAHRVYYKIIMININITKLIMISVLAKHETMRKYKQIIP